MTKQDGGAEGAIRTAALGLADAIAKGREAGLAVAWPANPEGLRRIAISEIGPAKVTLTVQAPDLDPGFAAKAGAAAQKAVDRVIEKA